MVNVQKRLKNSWGPPEDYRGARKLVLQNEGFHGAMFFLWTQVQEANGEILKRKKLNYTTWQGGDAEVVIARSGGR